MKILKFVVVLLLIVLFLIFVIQNVGQEITLKFFSEANSVTAEMVIVLLITLVIGFLIGFLVSGIQMLAAKNKLRILSSKYQKLKDELDLLRNKEIKEIEENQEE
jgi:uncharacterized integral membrane protein